MIWKLEMLCKENLKGLVSTPLYYSETGIRKADSRCDFHVVGDPHHLFISL